MTIDPKTLRELADRLAGDVLNQVERDGCLDRGKIAETLLCGLLLDAAAKPIIVDEAFTDAIEDAIVTGAGLVRVAVHALGERVTIMQPYRGLDAAGDPVGEEFTELRRGGLSIRYRSKSIRVGWSLRQTEALFAGLAHARDVQRCVRPLTDLDLVLLPSGELITGFEAIQRGVK